LGLRAAFKERDLPDFVCPIVVVFRDVNKADKDLLRSQGHIDLVFDIVEVPDDQLRVTLARHDIGITELEPRELSQP
jgi:hypothetical protein